MKFLMPFLFLAIFAVSLTGNANSDLAFNLILENLKMNQGPLETRSELVQSFQNQGRDCIELNIHSANSEIKPARILICGPLGFRTSNKKLPVLFISAGFFSGMASINLVQNPGEIILIGYEYPTTLEKIKNDPRQFLEAIRQVPGQIPVALTQIQKMQFVDKNKIHFMSVSLGTLFAPISLRVAAHLDVNPTSAILTFGGSDIGAVFDNYLQGKLPAAQIAGIRQLVSAATSLQDPRLHLPFLNGQFLFIGATQDEVFPLESQHEYSALLPSPKDIYWLESRHISPDRPEVIAATMRLVKEFINLPTN